eukprot:scaffold29512_cov110-Isochrysis_galbana.AAC.1
MTPGSSRCFFRASAGLNRAFPSLVLFGDILHSSLHAPLPVPVLATRDLERPRPSSRSTIAWCVAPVSPAVRPFLPCVSPACLRLPSFTALCGFIGSCERRRLSRQHVMMFYSRPPSSPLHLQ